MAARSGSSPPLTGTPTRRERWSRPGIDRTPAPELAVAAANRKVIGDVRGTDVRRSGMPTGGPAGSSRRSAGPPRAGSALAIANAASARVAARRGMASWATVTRTSRGAGGRARTISRSAAPAATPRTRPMTRKANSGAVTELASLGSGSFARRRHRGQGSCEGAGRQLRARSPNAHRVLQAEDADGRFGGVGAHRRSFVRARARPSLKGTCPAWPSIPPRNSSSSPSTPPGCSATSSARKPVRSGRTAAGT